MSETMKKWDGRSVGESAPHAAYCDIALQDAQIQVDDRGERVWSYDDDLFDRSLAGNGYRVVKIGEDPASIRSRQRGEALEEVLSVIDDFKPPQPDASEFSQGANFTARQLWAAIRSLKETP